MLLAQAPALHWQYTGSTLTVEADGLSREQLQELSALSPNDAAWARVLAVVAQPLETTGASASSPLPAVAGNWNLANDRLSFRLRFPPAPGVSYRAELKISGRAPIVAHFELPPRSLVPTTRVAQIFPSSDVLPENQLKFYVQFSAPMSRGDVYRHIHLRDAAGARIDLPFLELDEELWDPAMTRLTLLIDPGRIKRGVKPLEDIGPVFEAGKTYALVVDPACLDADGRQLQAAFVKNFRIGPPDRDAPDPSRWKINPPAANTREPLTIEFDEPMDQALALRLITLVAKAFPARAFEGRVELGSEERRWSFRPEEPWARGSYSVVVIPTIEDLAGNNIGKTFDVDLAAGATPRTSERNVVVNFDVK